MNEEVFRNILREDLERMLHLMEYRQLKDKHVYVSSFGEIDSDFERMDYLETILGIDK